MYPDNAYSEFYPASVVEKIWQENPNATREQLHKLMQDEWIKTNPPEAKMYGYEERMSWAECIDFTFGEPR